MYSQIKKHTTAKERAAIAKEHGVTSRAGLHYILNDKRKNPALLDALKARAAANKALKS